MANDISSVMLPWLALGGAAIGGMFSLYFWRCTVKTRRAEWLHSLYSKFYEEGFYKNTRILLDYRPAADIDKLYRGLDEGCYPEICEPLVDYLNFFEFIAGLWMMGQLSLSEVRMLFQYYIELLVAHPPVIKFIDAQGFENLRALIDALGSPR
ncbi:MAG: hypothetical protein WD069_05955 [Planctomycetales bacterium]